MLGKEAARRAERKDGVWETSEEKLVECSGLVGTGEKS